MAVWRSSHLVYPVRNSSDRSRLGSRQATCAGDGVRRCESYFDAKDRVAALLPAFVLLLLRPSIASGKINSVGIGGPRKGVNIRVTKADREGLAASGGNYVHLRDCAFDVSLFSMIRNLGLRVSHLSVREESNGVTIGGPLRPTVMAGLGDRNERASVHVVIKPEIVSEAVARPIGAHSLNDHILAVWRNLDRTDINEIEEIV